MNNQMTLVGLVIVTVAVMYLFYKYVKMEREYSNDISQLKQNIQEMSHMIALNNDIKIKRDTDVIPQPEVTQELKEELTKIGLKYPELQKTIKAYNCAQQQLIDLYSIDYLKHVDIIHVMTLMIMTTFILN